MDYVVIFSVCVVLVVLLKGACMLVCLRQVLRFPLVISIALFGRVVMTVIVTVVWWLCLTWVWVGVRTLERTVVMTVLLLLLCGPLLAMIMLLVSCLVTVFTVGCPVVLCLLLYLNM